MNSFSLSVESVGMVSSVGLDAASTCAAVRARLSRFEEIPFHDEEDNPIIAASVVEAVGSRQGHRRLGPLLVGAVRECVEQAPFSISRDVPWFVALDGPDRPDHPDDLQDSLTEELRPLWEGGAPQTLQFFRNDCLSFFQALQSAREWLRSGRADACVVAAVDSLINGSALEKLEAEERLKTEDGSEGCIPGEAAAAILLRKAPSSRGILEVAGLGFGHEPSALGKGANKAVGLAAAIKNALADAGSSLFDLDFRVGGMTGEQSVFDEASTGVARVQRVHKENFELWVPAEKLGYVGAALPACMLVLTAVGFHKGYAPGRSAILYGFSRSQLRAACVVRAPAGEHRG
jgi:3-oxoacyl-[acyl-carrier-protein] synthase I